MKDAEWLSKLKMCGQVERVWEVLYALSKVGERDEVSCHACCASAIADRQTMDTVCLLYLALLLESGSGIDLVLRADDRVVVALVLEMLRTSTGPLDRPVEGKMPAMVSWQNLVCARQLTFRSRVCATSALDSASGGAMMAS
jgi:hypothetical protein